MMECEFIVLRHSVSGQAEAAQESIEQALQVCLEYPLLCSTSGKQTQGASWNVGAHPAIPFIGLWLQPTQLEATP